MVTIDNIVRTRRRTLAIVIEPDGKLLVRAPLRVSEASIHAFVSEKQKWILAKQEQARARAARFAPKRFVGGEEFLYLGESYRLEIVNGRRPLLTFKDGFRLAETSVPDAARFFEKWYRRRALQVMSQRVEWFAAREGFAPGVVKVTSARKQWGSCGANGNLHFAWRLVMAPLPIIDYVVVHELVHLRWKRHGKRFWGRVKAILPDYRSRLAWLNEHGHLLSLD